MSVLRRTVGVLFILATLAAGAFVDIVLLLVGGITELVHGIQHDIAGQIGWGIGHILMSGVGMFLAVVLCFVWVAVFFGVDFNRKARRTVRTSHVNSLLNDQVDSLMKRPF